MIRATLLLALAFLGSTSCAQAQNPTCPTRPPGDSSNACASTAFVQAGIAVAVAGVRTVLTGDTVYNVNNSLGNDSNFPCTGTGASACQTYQGTMDALCKTIDIASYQVTIQGTSGQTYVENINTCNVVGAQTSRIAKRPILRGDPSVNPANVTLTCGTAACVSSVSVLSGWYVEGFTMNGTGSSFCLYADLNALMYAGVNILNCTGSHAWSGFFSRLYLVGAWTSVGSPGVVLNADQQSGLISIGTITFSSSNPAIFASSMQNSYINLIGTYSGSTAQTSACHRANTGGGIQTNGISQPCTAGDAITAPGWLQ